MMRAIYVQSIDCVHGNSLRATVYISLASDHLIYKQTKNGTWKSARDLQFT